MSSCQLPLGDNNDDTDEEEEDEEDQKDDENAVQDGKTDHDNV